MTRRARLGWVALALALVGAVLASRWLREPSPNASWPADELEPSGQGGRAAPSLAELEAASRDPGRGPGAGRPPSAPGTHGEANAPGHPAAGSASRAPGSSGAVQRGVVDAGVHTTTRLEALLHAAGLVDDERKDPQLSAFEQLAELPEGAPFEAVTREGRVVEATGDAPVPVGTPCQLRVLPARKDGFDCAVLVLCGGVIVYPDPRAAGGLNLCAYGPDGLPLATLDTQATDVDGDPTLTLQLTPGSVVIDDTVPAYVLRITLEGATAAMDGDGSDE